MVRDGQAYTVQSQIVTAFSLWLEKDRRQRVFWPSTIRLSADYFASLQRHAVPLDQHHLAALSHSAMALDVYAWLAQRLHRVGKGKGTPLPWTAVAAQFGGSGYERIRKFRGNFKVALGQVRARWPTKSLSQKLGGSARSPSSAIAQGRAIQLCLTIRRRFDFQTANVPRHATTKTNRAIGKKNRNTPEPCARARSRSSENRLATLARSSPR